MTWYEKFLKNFVQHYNHKTYWKNREKVIDPDCKYPKLYKLWLLFRIKKSDAFNNASMGTHLNYGAKFKTPPEFPHGIYGIIVSHNACIGENCRIFHQVTIGENDKGAPIIGDNCLIGAGAKIIGKIKIGNNVKIGANCIVAVDVPDNATVVMEKPRILIKKIEEDKI